MNEQARQGSSEAPAVAGASSQTARLEDSYLVQRLNKPPRPGGVFAHGNPFSFGGGYRNGGLTDDAMALLSDVFSFDYMGAAEFEFGAVPEALKKIASARLERFSFTVPLSEVPKHWRDKSNAKPDGDATIYVLCPADHAEAVKERIAGWAREEHPRLKEGLRLTSALRPIEEYDRDVCGWLELDNGFLFFTDETMWENACTLFGVPAPVPA